MSTDLAPQALIKSGPAKRPIVVPVDADGADSDPNNTPLSAASKSHSCFEPLLLQVLGVVGAQMHTCTILHTHYTYIYHSDEFKKKKLDKYN